MIGFSLTGDEIPAGSGVLTILTVDSDAACLSSLVLSDPSGGVLVGSIENCTEIVFEEACADVDEDGICDDVDDCVGAYDECQVCNGGGIAAGDCDCAGNVDLGCGCGNAGPSGCDTQCGSTAVVDECGVCGGSGVTESNGD